MDNTANTFASMQANTKVQYAEPTKSAKKKRFAKIRKVLGEK